METGNWIRRVALVCVASAACAAAPALAQVSFSINVGPPALLYEPVPMMAPGYVWAPGYWAWHENRHIWVHGRSMVQRNGYRWAPDRWDQRGNQYVRHPGRWERDNSRGYDDRGPRGNSGNHRRDGR